jgi:hypothetical protein
MLCIRVEIQRFADPSQPGWVEFDLLDARGQRHTFREKVPVVSSEDLDASSAFPRAGVVACTKVGAVDESDGRRVITVDTESPWGVESTDGKTRFELLAEQLMEVGDETG